MDRFPPPSFPPPAPGAASPVPPTGQGILDALLQGPQLPIKPKKGKKGMFGANKTKAKGGVASKIEKAIALLQGVVDELGPKSDISVSLSGIIKNLNMQEQKVSGGPSEEAITGGMKGQGLPPLGLGTPGQMPANVGAVNSPSPPSENEGSA